MFDTGLQAITIADIFQECNQSTLGLGVGGVGTLQGINAAHL